MDLLLWPLKLQAKQYNLENAAYKYKAIKHWSEIAGAFVEEAGKFTQAVDFQKGVLTVACLSRAVASQLRLMAEKIIEALNEVIGRKVIYAIFFEQ